MDAATRTLVMQRAANACEYCGISQEADPFFTFHVEHIIALQHGGTDDPENLAWSCPYCNRYKGPNLAGIDPLSGQVTRLFHPRQDSWDGHLIEQSGVVDGLTPVGRATASLLRMNDPLRVALRREISRYG